MEIKPGVVDGVPSLTVHHDKGVISAKGVENASELRRYIERKTAILHKMQRAMAVRLRNQTKRLAVLQEALAELEAEPDKGMGE